MERQALIVGVTGIVGRNLAEQLLDNHWNVVGLARRPVDDLNGLTNVAADLFDSEQLARTLAKVNPTHVFFTTWSRQESEAENIRVNRAMMRNLLDALKPKASVEHFALVTGLKHYLGPFEAYAQGERAPTPFRESQPRLAAPNFYYTLEDEVFAAAERDGFGWSVHRPHSVIGYAKTNVMNLGATLAVYATYCRETGRPFVFPGSEAMWQGLSDLTDARLLAQHLEWAAVTPAARNQALNIVNGDVIRWSWLWGRLAEYFGLEPAPFPRQPSPLAEQMVNAAPAWADIAKRHSLVESNIDAVASWWHTDADLGRPFECLTDMSKSRRLGFREYRPTDDAFFELFDRLQRERVISQVK